MSDDFDWKNQVKYILLYNKTYNNPIKACLSNKKYPVKIQTLPTQIINSLFIFLKHSFKY